MIEPDIVNARIIEAATALVAAGQYPSELALYHRIRASEGPKIPIAEIRRGKRLLQSEGRLPMPAVNQAQIDGGIRSHQTRAEKAMPTEPEDNSHAFAAECRQQAKLLRTYRKEAIR